MAGLISDSARVLLTQTPNLAAIPPQPTKACARSGLASLSRPVSQLHFDLGQQHPSRLRSKSDCSRTVLKKTKRLLPWIAVCRACHMHLRVLRRMLEKRRSPALAFCPELTFLLTLSDRGGESSTPDEAQVRRSSRSFWLADNQPPAASLLTLTGRKRKASLE